MTSFTTTSTRTCEIRPQYTMSFLKRIRSTSKRDSNMDPKAQDESNSQVSNSRTSTFSRPAFLNPSPATRRPTPAEPPPAYSPPPPSYSAIDVATSSTTVAAQSTDSDDKYAFLKQFDTVFLVDDSGSMAGRSWRETGQALEAITPICTKHDADGIDIHFLNAPQQDHFYNIKSASIVQRIFREQKPYGATPTGTRLNQILRPYLRDLEAKGPDSVKPLNIIVITDGVPTDDVESVIMFAARKLEKLEAPAWQVGIQFFQVGNEAEAEAALKELDDELVGENCPRDIVDTVPFSRGGSLSADGILKVVLGSVNRKLDRKRNSLDELRT